jgi:hypothetical protein
MLTVEKQDCQCAIIYFVPYAIVPDLDAVLALVASQLHTVMWARIILERQNASKYSLIDVVR